MLVNIDNYTQKKNAGLVQLTKLNATTFQITISVFDRETGTKVPIFDTITVQMIQDKKAQLQNQLNNINQLISDLQAL